jgi:hypothetical protein
MMERNYLPFKISDPHTLLKFRSLRFLSPPSMESFIPSWDGDIPLVFSLICYSLGDVNTRNRSSDSISYTSLCIDRGGKAW